MILKGHWL